MNWSQDFTVKSNARRAAKKLNVDVAKVSAFVKAGKTLYRFPMPAKATVAADKPAKAAKPAKGKTTKAKPVKAPKAATKPASAKPAGDRGGKFTAVAAMLRRPGGASMTEVVAATGWKPHSARARISVDVSKLLAKGEEITRRREDGVSHYAIVKSKQQDLPLGEAA
jgi:hypothetical protein